MSHSDGSTRSAMCTQCAHDFEFPARPGRAPSLCPNCRGGQKSSKKRSTRRRPEIVEETLDAPADALAAYEAALGREIEQLQAAIDARVALQEAIAAYRETATLTLDVDA